MLDSLSPLLQSIVTAILIGLGGALTAYTAYLLFVRFMKGGRYIGSLLALLIVIGTLKWILDVTDAVGLVVVLGTALTGALTLGMDDLARDLIAGAKLFGSRPFKIGDTISIAGQFGKVSEITLTTTVLKGETGNQIIVRNSDVIAGTIMNISSGADEQRVEVQVAIPTSQELEKVVTVIMENAQNFESLSKVGVVCETVTEGRMNLSIYGFTAGSQDLNAEKTRLMVATLNALKKNNISL